jgi:CxxC motif-containing protein (DUF1111 family)
MRIPRPGLFALALLSWLPLTARAQTGPAPAPPPPPANGRAAVPLPALTPTQLASFRDGLVAFQQAETPASGLGPIFNDVSCIACHGAPAPGGGSRRTVTRFGRLHEGVFDPLESQGGSLLQARALNRAVREHIPAEANVIARRLSTPLFGAGLIEAIPDSTLRAAAASLNKPDGIRGRVSIVQDLASGTERIGRFGWKAQVATLLTFSGDAYLNEMGITNRLFPVENAPNSDTARLARADEILDPEDAPATTTHLADIDRVTAFMRLLAPPAPARRPGSAANVATGRALFTSISCAACHTPTLRTGPSPVAALAHQPVNLYSDLLLHDMGSLGDGIAQGGAGPRDMRTAPLWGLGSRNLYLHDGRAATLDAAIRAHDGEAARARARYAALPPASREALLAFLRSL